MLLLSLFGVYWVLPSYVKETLLGWCDSFIGRKRKKYGAFFGQFGRREIEDSLIMKSFWTKG